MQQCSTECNECIKWRKTFFLVKLKPYLTASWTSWTEWTQCSASCGSGSRLRMRTCSGDSRLCVGDSTETEACETTDCPGAFSKWCTFCQIVEMSNRILWYFTFLNYIDTLEGNLKSFAYCCSVLCTMQQCSTERNKQRLAALGLMIPNPYNIYDNSYWPIQQFKPKLIHSQFFKGLIAETSPH